MRKMSWMAAGMLAAALAARAAEPRAEGGPPPGKEKGPPGGGPGRRFPGPGGGFFGQGLEADVFEAAILTLDLPGKAKAGVGILEAQFADEFQAATAELRLKMAREYVAMVLALLPDAEKPKYEAVAKALLDRDAAIAAALKGLRAVLDKVRANQAPERAPRDEPGRRFAPPGGTAVASKADVLRTHFALSQEQEEALDAAQRAAFEGMRGRFQALMPGPPGAGAPPGPEAFRRAAAAMRRVREAADDAVAQTAAEFLAEPQKKDYAAACAAIDAFRKNAQDAEEACRRRIVEAVGEEKANALLGPPPGKAAAPEKPAATF